MTTFSSPYESQHALVVDVNSSMRQIIASMLRAIGFKHVLVATNEVQSTEILKLEKVDIVICGWQADKLDGLKVLEKVRSYPKTKTAPFIMVTDMIDQELVRKAVQSGVSEYIVPPFNKQIFQRRLERALKVPIHHSALNVIKNDTKKRFNQKKNSKDLNILIVDDVADNIEILRGILKDHYKIRAVTSGKAVMKICLSEQPPDIILLDIMMPEIDGLTVCKQLKNNPMTQNIVVIFISALSETNDVVTGLELGAVDYITKPIQPDIVLARVNTHSKLVISQRIIQTQIDALLSDKQKRQKLESLYQKQIAQLNNSAIENANYLDSKLKNNNIMGRAFDQLTYCINVNKINIDNLLTLEQLEQNNYKVSRSRKETSNFVKALVQTFQFEIHEKHLEINLALNCNTAMFTDEKLATYLLAELIQNAIKFSPRGSKIHLTTTELSDHILFSIKNINAIDDSIINNFFQLFVSSSKDEGSGNGVGVYACFLIAKTLGAELYYHSSETYGTTFYFKLKK